MEITIWKISFLAGLILTVVGLIGGGLEVREIKLPRMQIVPRILSFVIGFGLLGLCIFRPDMLQESRRTGPIVEEQPPLHLTKITVRLKWRHQAQFAGFYVAKDKGFYRKAGLDVNLEPGGSIFPAIQQVVNGGEDFGVIGADQILLARGKGKDVVPLLVIYQHTPFVLFARHGGSIKKLEDIVGKRVGVAHGDSEMSIYHQMLAAAGIDRTSITEIPVGTDMSKFFSGEVDVWPGYAINEPIIADEKHVPVEVFYPHQFGIELYADTLFTTGAQIKQKPDTVKKFVKATREGWNYAIQHLEESVNITMAYASDSTKGHQLAMMKASLKSLGPPGDDFGNWTLAGWESTQQILLNGRFLEKPLLLNAMLLQAKDGRGS